jgi:hypothetical protein
MLTLVDTLLIYNLPRIRRFRWLNATQILKVAGVNKTARTKYLDREISKGVHQKIQGGYGKYQGTW